MGVNRGGRAVDNRVRGLGHTATVDGDAANVGDYQPFHVARSWPRMRTTGATAAADVKACRHFARHIIGFRFFLTIGGFRMR